MGLGLFISIFVSILIDIDVINSAKIMNNMDKKILIYCRVSTQQQTTDRQKEELLKFAEDNHWNVAEEDIFIDVISGFKRESFVLNMPRCLKELNMGILT
ncbi:recombinase family protein [Bacteroides fragilis]